MQAGPIQKQTRPAVKGAEQPKPKNNPPSNNPLLTVPTSVRIRVGDDTELVNLSTSIQSATIDLDPPVHGPRDVNVLVRVSAIHPADAHPGLDVRKIEIYDANGKRVAQFNNPTALQQTVPSRDAGPLFNVKFASKSPQTEMQNKYAAIVTTGVGDEKKAFTVRSELTAVFGAI